MILADIDAGSHTPTLVSKVLKWHKEQPEEANKLWNELGAYNSKVEQHFRDLTSASTNDESAYTKSLAGLAQLPASQVRRHLFVE
jgi:phosphomevalonate kinase